jgi:hypothetical protein
MISSSRPSSLSVSSGVEKCSDPGMWAARYSQSPRAFTSFRGSLRSSFSLSSRAEINRMAISPVAPTKARVS